MGARGRAIMFGLALVSGAAGSGCGDGWLRLGFPGPAPSAQLAMDTGGGQGRSPAGIPTPSLPFPTPSPSPSPSPSSSAEPLPTGSPLPGPTPSPTASPPPARESAARVRRLLELTDAFRVESGLAPLQLDARLTAAAQSYAEKMAREGFFDHASPDGSTPVDRLIRAGYHGSTWGENLAAGYSTPEATLEAWIKSPGHRANLRNAGFSHVGVGHCLGASREYGEDYPYWVQEFGAPSPDSR